MSFSRRTIGIMVGLLWALTAQRTDAQQPMTVDDGLRLKTIRQVELSPDGHAVLYTVESLDWAENDTDRKHFLYRESSRSSHELIGDGGGRSFQFSPDGLRLAFLRKPGSGSEAVAGAVAGSASEGSQIFVMPLDGGEALQLTHHRGGVSRFAWLPTSDGLIFLADAMADEEAEKERKRGDDSYFVDEAPHGKHAARYTHFWSIGLSDKKEKQRSHFALVVGDFDLSPDGSQLVFDARPDTRTNHPGDAELYRFSIEQGTLERLTDNAAPESNPMWSPDGKLIAYRAPDDRRFELRNGFFWIMDADSKATRRLAGQSTGELRGASAWSADSRYLLYNEIHGTDTNLYRIDGSSGQAEALTAMTGTLRARAFSTDTERMVYGYQNFTTPQDLYISDLKTSQTHRITDLNPWVEASRTLSDGQLLRWTSKGDMPIEGVFFPALGTSRGEKTPLIVHVHGGPAGVVANAFRSDFHLLSGLGFAILAPNFRGSTGYGDEVLRGLMGEVGDGEFLDIMGGVDWAITERNIDPDRLGIRGWSWGGVSTSYVITQTDRFKAASIGAMVGNWAAETGPGFNFDVSLWYIGGMPWDRPEEWRKRSSISHVKNVSTPSILFHGGKDETSSVGQSLMFYTALREIGKAPVKYMNFPREGHGVDEPRHRRRLQIEEIVWFKRYIQDQEWHAEPPTFDPP